MKTVLFLFIAAVAVGGLVLFGLFGSDKTSENIQTESQSEVVEQDEQDEGESNTFVGLGTLEDLQNLGESLECTISYEAPELEQPVSGTYFVSGQNVRGDFELYIAELGGSSVSSVIFTKDMFYSWSEIAGQTYGVKMPIDTLNDTAVEDRQEPIPSNVDISYDCIEWVNVDFSIFEAPGDVLFRDVGQLLQGGMEYGTIYEEGEF